MDIDSAPHISKAQATQKTPLLKTANDLPKLALQLIPPVPQPVGNIGKNIDISV